MYRIIGFIIALLPGWVDAGEPARPAQQSRTSSVNVSAPPAYCGVYSLHRAASALGRDVPFHVWLKPEYISSWAGSSLSDLSQAAMDQGLNAEPMGRMTCAMLRFIHCPVILHVKNDLAIDKEYNHWILFTGAEDGKARIYDGVRLVELVDFTDLAARWDGVGLLVDKAPITTSFLWLVVASQFVFCAGACAAVIALLLWLQHRWTSKPRWASWSGGWRRSTHDLAMLVVLAFVLGAGFRWVHAGGFLSHTPSIAALQDMHLGGFLSKVKVEDIPKLMQADGITIVDARSPQDFTAGHLENAINIPPNSSQEQCEKALADVSASNRILLYCQSNGCPYSEIVARKLIALGHSNILYFRDGWIAWEKYHQNTGP